MTPQIKENWNERLFGNLVGGWRCGHPRAVWRSRHGNAVNPFYYAESDGCLKQERWKVFWYGLGEDFATIARCVAHCATRQPTLVD